MATIIVMFPEFLIACNVALCAVLILLGFYQTRYVDGFSITSAVLMCANGACAVLLYGRTDLFPAAAFGCAFLLLIHGGVVHFPLTECSEHVRSCPMFRFRCVCNHETWVLVAATAGLVSAFRV